jgi:predicted Rossmann fold flavoprotein
MSGRAERVADVLIVGGGAAGLLAAIAAGRSGAARTVLLDSAARLGAKILISGGGRCNVTNARVSPRDFNGGSRRVVERVLRAFPAARTVELFAELGVPLHEEARGKLFPDTERARTVLDALVRGAGAAGVPIATGERVTHVSRRADAFDVATSAGGWTAGRVLLATGGLSVPKTGSDGHGLRLAAALGHSIVPTTPALVPLVLGDGIHDALSGVSLDVTVDVVVDGRVSARIEGPLLWTHAGVSGPAPLDASRHWHRATLEGRAVEVRVNLAGSRTFEEVDRALTGGGRASVRTALEAWMPGSVAAAVLGRCGVDAATSLAQLPREARRAVAHAVTALALDVTGSRGFSHAEATAGGVPLDEIEPATMESRKCPGLYLAGEMLDVDGRLGGFNFQWAWSSGWIAGRAAARSMARQP